MRYRSTSRALAVYTTLIVGAIVFSLPFVWMGSTSAKVDRELFTRDLTFLPISPQPRVSSPYIDNVYYDRLEGPHQQQLLPKLVELIRTTKFELPDDVDHLAADQQIARGLYRKLARIMPSETWTSHPDETFAAATQLIDREMIEQAFDTVHRRLRFGPLRVRSVDLGEQELGANLPLSRRFDNLSPQVASLHDRTAKNMPHTSVNYNFTNGDRIVLTKTFTLDFDVSQLKRIQLYMQPDDTWHELWLTVEKLGAKYVSERPIPLANFNWMMATWQEPSADDRPTKIKTWTLLHESDRSPDYVRDPHSLKLTFELRRSSKLRAWWHKLALNYRTVLSQIPFWRYVGTSVFLVVANIILTLLSCSLVAYAFARLQWPGRNFCFVLMLATMMIPHQVTMIPHFLIWKNLGLYNTLTPLWLGHAFGNAFFIFLLRQFLKGIPRDLEDAARIDGCGFLRIYWHIMLPLIKPSLAAIAIFTFMASWNDFLGPLIYIADQRLYPLAFGLYAFAVQVNNNPTLTMAGSLLMTLPVIVLFFFAQRYFIQGVTLTGMKA